MAVIADVSITPIGEGTSESRYVKRAVEELKKTGLQVEIGALSTTLQADNTGQIFDAVQRAKEAVLRMGAKRLQISVRIDERVDKPITISKEIEEVVGT